MSESKANNSLENPLSWLRGKKIVFIGDSITADNKSNYVTLTINEIANKIDVNSLGVVNYGVDSYSIHDALDMIPEIIIEEDPDVFVIFIGVNDSKVFHYLNRPLIAPDLFKDSYSALLDRIDASGGMRYKVLVTLPALPFDEIDSGEFLVDYWYWKPSLYLQYTEAIRELGNRERCSVAEIYESFRPTESNGVRLFYEDGVHPNIYGHRIISDAVVKALSNLAK